MKGIVVEVVEDFQKMPEIDFDKMAKRVQKLSKKVDDLLLRLNSEQLLDVGLGLGIRKGRIENRSNLVVLREIGNYIEKRCLESPEVALGLLNPLYRDLSERLKGDKRTDNSTESEPSEAEVEDFESAKEDGTEPEKTNDDMTDRSDTDGVVHEGNTDDEDENVEEQNDKDKESEEEEPEGEKELENEGEKKDGNDSEEDPEDNDQNEGLPDEGNKRLVDENESLREQVRKLEIVLREKELEAEEKELKKQADEDKLRKLLEQEKNAK